LSDITFTFTGGEEETKRKKIKKIQEEEAWLF